MTEAILYGFDPRTRCHLDFAPVFYRGSPRAAGVGAPSLQLWNANPLPFGFVTRSFA